MGRGSNCSIKPSNMVFFFAQSGMVVSMEAWLGRIMLVARAQEYVKDDS